METANILIENEDKLQLSWSPGCFYKDGRYSVGICGTMGSVGPGAESPKAVPNLTVPISLLFIIKTSDSNLAERIDQSLKKLQDSMMHTYCKISEQARPIRVKEEFIEKVSEMHQNEEKKKIIREELFNKLREMGCNVTDYDIESAVKIPQEWYEPFGEIKYNPARIDIYCRSGTYIYRALLETKLLDKYFPEWYRKGLDPHGYNVPYHFFCTNFNVLSCIN